MRLLKHKSGAGFTVLELLVSVAIIGIILSVVVQNFRTSGSGIVLTNAAYEVALAVRRAQVNSLSVAGSGTEFRGSYGVRMDAATPGYVTLFRDECVTSTNKGVYNPPGSPCADVDVERVNLPQGYTVYTTCLAPSCTSVTTGALDVTFVRPNPDARIKRGGTSSTVGTVTIADTTGRKKSVTIQDTGQIYVHD